jgi:hypothetical protein
MLPTRPPGGKSELLFALVPALLEVVVPKLAMDGDFEPPHPAASNERAARANNEQRALEPDIVSQRKARLSETTLRSAVQTDFPYLSHTGAVPLRTLPDWIESVKVPTRAFRQRATSPAVAMWLIVGRQALVERG